MLTASLTLHLIVGVDFSALFQSSNTQHAEQLPPLYTPPFKVFEIRGTASRTLLIRPRLVSTPTFFPSSTAIISYRLESRPSPLSVRFMVGIANGQLRVLLGYGGWL